MKDYIINSFFLQNKNTIANILHYVQRFNKLIDLYDVQLELQNLIKKNIVLFTNNVYELTNEGKVILNDIKYYYSKIIFSFFFKLIVKKYQVKEIREEQNFLRKFLIANKEHKCIICDKKLPLCLLETAHLKPRSILNNFEKIDIHIVEFMCRYCHSLYDNGLLAVYNGLLYVSQKINDYDLDFPKNKKIKSYNLQNEIFFSFHFKYIFKKNIKSMLE